MSEQVDTKTSVIVQAMAYIMDNPAVNHWMPFMADHNLGIPYAIGIELGHITNLNPEGWDSIDETYKDLCEALGREKLSKADLEEIFFPESQD